MTDNTNTNEMLEGRKSTYGDTTQNAERVAKMWNGYLGTDIITPADMMMMMALYKAYRFKVTPDYSDNINDVLGYAQIVRNVQQDTGGLIHAETVREYVDIKNKGNQSEGRLIDTVKAGPAHEFDLAVQGIKPVNVDFEEMDEDQKTVMLYGTLEQRQRLTQALLALRNG